MGISSDLVFGGGLALERFGDWGGWRIKYITLWAAAFAFVRYFEAIAKRRILLARAVAPAYGTLIALGIFAPYEWNKRVLPLGQALLMATLALALVMLATSPIRRGEKWLILGSVSVFVCAGCLEIASVALTGLAVPGLEFAALGFPLAQMAVLALRAAEARA